MKTAFTQTGVTVSAVTMDRSVGRRLCLAALLSAAALLAACACVAPLASALPPERHYEMVSPVYKGGYGVSLFKGLEAVGMAGAWEGERAIYTSLGAFAGAPSNQLVDTYLAQRGPGGWSTSPLSVPAAVLPSAGSITEVAPSLESAIFEAGYPGLNAGEAEGLSPEPEFLTHPFDLPDTAPSAPSPGPNFEVFGSALKRLDAKPLEKTTSLGGSANLCHLLFETAVGSIEHEPLLEEAIGTESDLYELVSGAPGCGGPALRLVGVGNSPGPHGQPQSISAYCPTFLGGNERGESNQFNAISADGSEIFFTSNPVHASEACDGYAGAAPANPAALYLRLNGERTLQVSKPLAQSCEAGELCAGAERAEFMGANEAGSRAFFTSAQPQLVPGVSDTSENLYMATIGCAEANPGCAAAEREVTSLVQVSAPTTAGEAAEVQGAPLAVSADGTRAYFVARGVLSAEGPVGEGVRSAPVKGADNLYVYEAPEGGQAATRFVGDLCSGPERSGEAADARCPATSQAEGANSGNDTGLWRSGGESQTAGADGRFLLFTTYARLIDGGPERDTDDGRDVYRYDAQAATLVRVSVGEGEYDANGNGNGFDAEIPRPDLNGQVQEDDMLALRAIDENGERVVFETAEPLSPAAENHLVNAYEWHGGRVSLVSSGSDEEPVGASSGGVAGEIAITPSGRDIFFKTPQKLTAQDTDGAIDVYDARLGPGFPAPLAELAPCKGDACQGPLTNPAPLLIPGSVSQPAGENVPAPAAPAVKLKKRPKRRPAAHRKRKRRRARRASRRSRAHATSGGRRS